MYRNVYISFKVFSFLKKGGMPCLCIRYLCILKIKVHVTKTAHLKFLSFATCLCTSVDMFCFATCGFYIHYFTGHARFEMFFFFRSRTQHWSYSAASWSHWLCLLAFPCSLVMFGKYKSGQCYHFCSDIGGVDLPKNRTLKSACHCTLAAITFYMRHPMP